MKPQTQIISNAVLSTLLVFLFATNARAQEKAEKLKPLMDAYAGVWNSGKVDDLDSIVAPQFKRHAGPTSNTSADGIEALKKVVSAFRTSYPDFNVTLDDEIYTANKVAVRWTFTGTNTGAGDFPATGKKVELPGISIFSIANGKIVEEWVAADNLHLLQQLGFTVTPPAAK